MFWKDETDVLEVTSKKACLTGEGSADLLASVLIAIILRKETTRKIICWISFS